MAINIIKRYWAIIIIIIGMIVLVSGMVACFLDDQHQPEQMGLSYDSQTGALTIGLRDLRQGDLYYVFLNSTYEGWDYGMARYFRAEQDMYVFEFDLSDLFTPNISNSTIRFYRFMHSGRLGLLDVQSLVNILPPLELNGTSMGLIGSE